MITLSQKTEDALLKRVHTGQFGSADELVAHALEALDYRDWLQRELQEGIESGPGILVDKEYFARKKQLLRERHAAGEI